MQKMCLNQKKRNISVFSFFRNMFKLQIIIIAKIEMRPIYFLILVGVIHAAVLSSVNFQSNIITTYSYLMSNMVGLSMTLDQTIPYYNSTLFKGYLSNSNVYGDWYCNFDQSIHVPLGYKYNCSIFSAMNASVNCTIDLQSNTTILSNMGGYVWDTTMYYAFTIGWDMQAANFSNSDYIIGSFKKFVFDLYNRAGQPINIQMADRGNQFASMGFNPNYTAAMLLSDCNLVNNVIYGLMMTGPGATQTADVTWYNTFSDISYYCGYFTARAVVFQNVSDLTIDNLLSQTYTKGYLQKRFTVNGTSFTGKFWSDYGGINDIRLVSDPAGVDGLTNSFAAALWSIQMIMQFAIMGGIRIDFFNPIDIASFQSVTGRGPLFAPSSLYYGLLFTIIANRNQPYIQIPAVSPGTSMNIKVYGLDYYSTYGFIILNKDTDPSKNGQVRLSIWSKSGVSCVYLTAASLSSTSVKLGNVEFVANNSNFVGNYSTLNYYPDASDGYYYVNVSYAQAVFCKSLQTFTQIKFPRKPKLYEYWFSCLLGLLILVVMI